MSLTPKKIVKFSVYPISFLIIFLISLASIFPSRKAVASDRSQEMLNYINQTISGSSNQIGKMKNIYLDLISKYPEIKQKKPSRFQIVINLPQGDEEETEDGSCDPDLNGPGPCFITLNAPAFNKDLEIKNAFFHELLHCWSGIDFNSYPSLEEESVWPIAQDYAPFYEFGVPSNDLFKTMTNIFKARGDTGDNWRILMAVRAKGPSSFNKRLSFLPLPSGFSSPSQYINKMVDEKKYNKLIQWLNSRTPPPANYTTINFDGSGGGGGGGGGGGNNPTYPSEPPGGVGVSLSRTGIQSGGHYTVSQYVWAIYAFSMKVAVALATLMVIYAGYKYLTSRGDSGAINEAKDILFSTLMGAALLMLVILVANLAGLEISAPR